MGRVRDVELPPVDISKCSGKQARPFAKWRNALHLSPKRARARRPPVPPCRRPMRGGALLRGLLTVAPRPRHAGELRLTARLFEFNAVIIAANTRCCGRKRGRQ
jgi:hypothetical protein